MERGYLQVYTGNGKGKTTCMLGLTLRAAGAGFRIYIGQFMKDDEYSEISALRRFLPQVTVEQYGDGGGFIRKGGENTEARAAAQEGYQKALAALSSGAYDLVILDECNVALYMELLTEEQVHQLIDSKPVATELVLTGRYAADSVIARADLVTEMTQVKHYFEQNVRARVGIER